MTTTHLQNFFYFEKLKLCWAWWNILVISALGKLRQEDDKAGGQAGLHSKAPLEKQTNKQHIPLN
jgi:hypothetical protein